MSVTERQLEQVESRMEYTCITRASEGIENERYIIHVRRALRLAFVLGARFGAMEGELAGQYTAAWLHKYNNDAELSAMHHQGALTRIISPLTEYIPYGSEGDIDHV